MVRDQKTIKRRYNFFVICTFVTTAGAWFFASLYLIVDDHILIGLYVSLSVLFFLVQCILQLIQSILMIRSVGSIFRLAERQGIDRESIREIRINLWISILTAINFITYFGLIVVVSILREVDKISYQEYLFFELVGDLSSSILMFVCFCLIIYVFLGYAFKLSIAKRNTKEKKSKKSKKHDEHKVPLKGILKKPTDYTKKA